GQAGLRQGRPKRLPHGGVFHDDQQYVHAPTLSTVPALPASGSVTMKDVPSPGMLSTSISPPCSFTRPCTTESPSPQPLSFVVKNGLNSCGRSLSAIPQPVSVTRTRTQG